MKSDIVVIGGGAAGLAAAIGAASQAAKDGQVLTVSVLEKMPRPARKVMITGKGRCNFTNLKDWEDFRAHIRTSEAFLKPAFFNLTPRRLVERFEALGLPCVVERGDRVFPASHRASDVVDTLARAARSEGARMLTDCTVTGVERTPVKGKPGSMQFSVGCADGSVVLARRLVIATGGLSYPRTGSTGDGYGWAEKMGHTLQPCFPSLTALVPAGYKQTQERGLIVRETPLSAFGRSLCGIQLKNVGLALEVDSHVSEDLFGDVDFTDGGLEGPLGFQLSRDAVRALQAGSRVALLLDLKYGVDPGELAGRVEALWETVRKDPRSARLHPSEMLRILLGKLMPWDLIPAFRSAHPALLKGKGGRPDLPALCRALQSWRFPLDGYVGYERCVVTAGGVTTAEVLPKTLESRLVEGLYFAGEVLDVDCDTGGYNLHAAFSTGFLAGQSAAKSLKECD